MAKPVFTDKELDRLEAFFEPEGWVLGIMTITVEGNQKRKVLCFLPPDADPPRQLAVNPSRPHENADPIWSISIWSSGYRIWKGPDYRLALMVAGKLEPLTDWDNPTTGHVLEENYVRVINECAVEFNALPGVPYGYEPFWTTRRRPANGG